MFSYMWKYILKNKQTRLILMLTVGISLLITAIGLLSYRQYRKALDTELNTPNVELLQINMDVTNRAFAEADNKAVDLSFHPAVLAFVEADAQNELAVAGEPLTLLETLAGSPDIRSIAVVKFDDRAVLASDYGYMPDWKRAPGHSWSEWIGEMENKPLLIKRRTEDAAPGKLNDIELLTLARPVVSGGEVKGAVMVHMDYDWLFSKMYTQLSSHQFVYTLDGEVIYPKLNMPFGAGEMNRVLAAIDVSPFAHVTVDGQDYMANQTFSNVTGWRMVSLVPMEHLLRNVKIARNMLLTLSLISIFIGCCAIYYYNFAAFRPLKRINRLLHPGDGGGNSNLYDLEPVIGKLVGEFRSKSLVAEWSLPELRSKLLRDMVTRSIGTQELNTKWGHYFEGWGQGPTEVLLLSIDRHTSWAAGFMDEDQLLLKYAMNNVVSEYFEREWLVATAHLRKDSLVVVLQSKGGETTLTEEDCGGLVGMLGELVKMSVTIGIGTSAATVSRIVSSYEEAERAVSYRLYEGYGKVRHFGQLSEPDEGLQPPDETWKAGLLASVKAGDGEAAKEWAIKGLNDYGKKNPHPQRVLRIIDDLLEELQALAALGGVPLPADLADYTRHVIATMELADIRELLGRVSVQLAEGMVQRKQTKEYRLVQSMIEFMEEHLHENIGLQDIASHAGMGVSSLSTMFKDGTGSTVYDYLTNLRIDKACRLLQDTGMKMADIAALVGYQNENSFIRAFRKVKSTTPGKFRESSKSSGEYADLPKPRHSGLFED